MVTIGAMELIYTTAKFVYTDGSDWSKLNQTQIELKKAFDNG